MDFPAANSQTSSALFFEPEDHLSVLLPLPLAGPYDYKAGPGQRLAPGDFVRVPLGGRKLIGVVWGRACGTVTPEKCRAVLERLDLAPLPEVSRRFVSWVASYTLSLPGAVLRMVMSVPAALEPPAPPPAGWVAADPPPAGLRLTAARQRVLAMAATPATAADLAQRADTGTAVVRGLIEAGALVSRLLQRRLPAHAEPDEGYAPPRLSEGQEVAATSLRAAVGSGFSVTLLEGVTGSGKTEVYFEALAETLRQGRQVLVLLPEIALSAQWLARFKARFGVPPLIWHSEVAPAARRDAWRAIAAGEARVVVGARSALFLPFADLGLIIVDEEHDASFKQEEGVIYHARDMAVVRARVGGVPVVLASATPSLETQANVQAGRYQRLHLPERHGGALMPQLAVVDMRRHAPARQTWLSQPLVDAVTRTLEDGEQVLLYLNRRGYAPLTLCRTCGHRLQCPHCSAWLVDHRRAGGKAGRLQCHHCGYLSVLPERCPSCDAEESFVACGPGVERLAEEVAMRFPDARRAVMASDTLTGPGAAQRMVAQMAAKEIDLLIGTQVVAKGHHFPLLTLVGVVDADLGLAGGDLRAAERTFQLLSQVAGRAGRAERPGRVLLQTYQPDDKVMQALISGDAERFYAAEADDRRAAVMPPFGKLAALIVSGTEAEATDRLAALLARTAPRGDGIEVFGPAPAPLALLRGRHRRRLLLKTARRVNVQALLKAWLERVNTPRDLRIQVDVDPYSFF